MVMKINLRFIKDTIQDQLDEAQLSDDEDRIIAICSILSDVEDFEKELHEKNWARKALKFFKKAMAPEKKQLNGSLRRFWGRTEKNEG